jgi:hypothetical protein
MPHSLRLLSIWADDKRPKEAAIDDRPTKKPLLILISWKSIKKDTSSRVNLQAEVKRKMAVSPIKYIDNFETGIFSHKSAFYSENGGSLL